MARDRSLDGPSHELLDALVALTTVLKRDVPMMNAVRSSIGGYRTDDGKRVEWSMADLLTDADRAIANAKGAE